jgi:hypothetical protein
MTCGQAKTLFSPYLDGMVTGKQMHELDLHLQGCTACNSRYVSLQQVQQLVSKAGRRKPPADLSLKLRVAMSREVARSKRPILEGVGIRLQNAIDAFMVPATAGLVTAVLIFGVVMGLLAPPLQADNADVPLLLHTAPQLQESSFGAMDAIHGDSLVVEAYVDSDGRVQDYRILSDTGDKSSVPSQVKNMMLGMMMFTRFRPATSMGRPTAGRAVISFSKISVKG